MTFDEALAYVRAAAVAAALPIEDARARRVAAHLVVSAGLAALVSRHALNVDDEPAELFCPAPFPAQGTLP